ncbi:MAG: hypothetical protein AAGC81_06405 [Pseudomonadota bacterium]
MAVLRVNATRSGELSTACQGASWRLELDRALERLAPEDPVCILIHGYRFTWRADTPCLDPHLRLFGAGQSRCGQLRPVRGDWAGWLGFSEEPDRDGLCIAFGWEARSTKSGGRSRTFAKIYRDAAKAAGALGILAAHIAARRPGLSIDMLAHSLGARVALNCLSQRPLDQYGRVILMGAAEFVSEAEAALAAPHQAEIYHMLSRANDPFDGLFGLLAPTQLAMHQVSLGIRGLGRAHARWIDLQLDLPALGDWLEMRGHRLTREERVSHWHFYADAGAMGFYRAILRHRPPHAIRNLRAARIPEEIEPRWSRLISLPTLGADDWPTTGTPLPNRG